MDTSLLPFYIVVFLFGIMVGSFLNVCILRIPKQESIITVPSYCMCCGRRLKWYELIPLFSWLFLRGKCGGCGSSISPQYPLIEAANGALWVLVFVHFSFTPYALLCCLVTSALLALSVIDGRTGEIPPGFNIFILCLALAHLPLDLGNWLTYVIGFFAVSLPLLLILLATGGRGIGGGDMKLMAVCGLFLGWRLVLISFVLGCVLGSVIHLVRMRVSKADRVLALGPYLSAGVFLSMLWGAPLLNWYLGILMPT
jgi:leader peptidase (prepilin peptidase)/N-methyltransferase